MAKQIDGLWQGVADSFNALRGHLAGNPLSNETYQGYRQMANVNSVLGTTSAVISTFVANEIGSFKLQYATTVTTMLSGHDQFGNAVYNLGQGNFGQAAMNAGELIANVGGTIFSNTKIAGTKLGKRIAWPITLAEFGYTSWSVSSERLEFIDFETTRQNLEANNNEARSNLTQAKNLYRENCN